MEKETLLSEASPANLAQLQDRILVRQGHKQLYGTQSRINENGQQVSLPSEDGWQERRKIAGLDAL